MSLPYPMELVPDPDEGGFAVSFPDLPGCLSVGDTPADAVRNARDALREWLAAALEDGVPIPEPDSLEAWSGQFRLRMPRSLHRRLALQARREGVSMNQYCVWHLSQDPPRL